MLEENIEDEEYDLDDEYMYNNETWHDMKRYVVLDVSLFSQSWEIKMKTKIGYYA